MHITQEMLERFRFYFQESAPLKISQSAFLHTKITDTAMNWDRFANTQHYFSKVISHEMKITNQKQSGRCWLFAACNMLRILIGRKYNIDQFELSTNHLMFFDKLEKINFFLENIIKTADEPYDSRNVMFLLHSPIGDGGQWHMFVNLVKKYGLMPKSAMPDTFQSQNTVTMNHLLLKKIREFAMTLRKCKRENRPTSEIADIKAEMLKTVHAMLESFLGTPPQEFDWEFYDKNGKFHSFKKISPHEFVEKHVPVNLSDYVCLINCPMQDTPYHQTFTVEFLGNVVEGSIVRYVNLPMDMLKRLTLASLQKDEPVWFGCDVGQSFHRDQGIMDLKLYQFETMLQTKFPLTKQQRLEHGESKMTHAMLLNGVDIVDNHPTKWRVENSWGKDYGKDGFFVMTDAWFDEYVYEVAIHKRFLDKAIIELEKQSPITLAPWHPMGALA
ncbi:MAG: C1 family peptidase [Chlamydiae bacterium]|nr:C1 family peptidase [Chlamydiota bacterium]